MPLLLSHFISNPEQFYPERGPPHVVMTISTQKTSFK